MLKPHCFPAGEAVRKKTYLFLFFLNQILLWKLNYQNTWWPQLYFAALQSTLSFQIEKEFFFLDLLFNLSSKTLQLLTSSALHPAGLSPAGWWWWTRALPRRTSWPSSGTPWPLPGRHAPAPPAAPQPAAGPPGRNWRRQSGPTCHRGPDCAFGRSAGRSSQTERRSYTRPRGQRCRAVQRGAVRPRGGGPALAPLSVSPATARQENVSCLQ